MKGSIAAAGSLAVAGMAFSSITEGSATQELATLIDIRKCIGCEACIDGCHEANEFKFPQPIKPFPTMYPSRVKVADWSDKKGVSDRLTPYNWLYIQSATVTINGQEQTYTFPRRCMHCQNPPCADLCPWGAARKLRNGITRIHSDICLGGSKCKSVCPWHIPERQTGVGLYLHILPSFVGNGVMYKCDRCYDKIREGKTPGCIEICPEKVQKIGPRDEIVKEAHEIARDIGGYIYGEKENGGTNTLYVSPVPFDELNKVIEKGPGRPHFDEVPNLMEHADNLGKAMIIGPFAGAASFILRFYKYTKDFTTRYTEDTEKSHKKIVHALYIITFILMALTGFGQMPIFKRYYLADIPGFAWTARYYVTHYMHYLGALFLFGLFTYIILDYFLIEKNKFTLTHSSYIKIFFLIGIVITGIFRVLKNMPTILFSPGFTFFIDIAHFGCMVFYAVTALFSRVWLRSRQ
ncbi:MAG: 4Fe-4S dicluster domain-containing protein [bacterium]